MASANNPSSPLAVTAREIFTRHAVKFLPEIAKDVLAKLVHMVDQCASLSVMHERRDAWINFQSVDKAWTNGINKAWNLAIYQAPSQLGVTFGVENGKFELMDNEVMESKILVSRLELKIVNAVSWEFNDLRLRIQSLDKVSELSSRDMLRPDNLAWWIFEQWTAVGMSRSAWMSAQDVIENRFAEHLLEAYHITNEFLIQHGILVDIDLRPLVKRTATGVSRPEESDAKSGAYKNDRVFHLRSNAYSGLHGNRSSAAEGEFGSGGGNSSSGLTRSGSQAHEETRMQTATTPLARAKMRAQGVMGGLMRLLTNQVDDFDDNRRAPVSPQLSQALAGMVTEQSRHQRTHTADTANTGDQVHGVAHVQQASAELRQRSSSLKKAATTSTEKATIEIVALMFQSILAEDRIPPAIRVWFARLQMPVLRVAIFEPEFFGSLQHPARRLIDRMGSCVLGFDVAVSGSAMEIEIKRVVQVIEQYPETGRRVFQLVYDEFQKFLSKFLAESGSVARVVSIAQQVEQKETMAIQYTIEMRKMLNDMPVRDEIREFLFKTWAEVLAVAAMRNGPQYEQTITLKRCAADLVWAASAKPNRSDRAKVIADLPKLLQLLRLGMSMLGMDTKAQEENIKIISDTLADAFMSKTGAISSERIEAMAKHLTNLEDCLSDEDVGDLPLDTEALVMMIGIDASDIEVVTDGGSQPTEAMRSCAHELQLGSWFSLDHNGLISHVQFAWRSDRKQLHLFASSDGRNFLIQASRLAAYLQAGLLLPAEEEALTVRATRDALAKLEANPERLLG